MSAADVAAAASRSLNVAVSDNRVKQEPAVPQLRQPPRRAPADDDDDDDDDDEEAVPKIDRSRTCPYLDTINRCGFHFSFNVDFFYLFGRLFILFNFQKKFLTKVAAEKASL